MLYEVDTIRRFAAVGNFLSYARLVACTHESAGKVKGVGGRKIGNAHLKWAFSEATSLMLRCFPAARSWMQRQSKIRGLTEFESNGLKDLAAGKEVVAVDAA